MNALIPLLLALAVETAPRQEAPIPDKVHATPEGDELPDVTVRAEDNGDKVEEYRQNGKLYMVKVTPARGPAYYLMDTDGDGKFNRDDVVEHVAPVYWTIYEWD